MYSFNIILFYIQQYITDTFLCLCMFPSCQAGQLSMLTKHIHLFKSTLLNLDFDIFQRNFAKETTRPFFKNFCKNKNTSKYNL